MTLINFERVMIGIGAAIVAGLFLFVLPGLGPTPTHSGDNCKLTEQQIRQLWVAARVNADSEAERTQVTADLVGMAERLCRSGLRDPAALPVELQRLVR